jgi:hypothetical protein
VVSASGADDAIDADHGQGAQDGVAHEMVLIRDRTHVTGCPVDGYII